MTASHHTLVAKDLRDVNAIRKRLSELWKKANEFLDIISACENGKVYADAADKHARAQRKLAQLREQAKEEVTCNVCKHRTKLRTEWIVG